ncbi:collagen alpha-1(I) chain-like [Mustela erminea]|uniref:collagen alpha-1(I) chain-like n=1 Tax=Mustela erminea TaxID=36723 RepID=UPI0013867EA4|nr:collagen alpha-1(I) chain-like [Mustela erminea]
MAGAGPGSVGPGRGPWGRAGARGPAGPKPQQPTPRGPPGKDREPRAQGHRAAAGNGGHAARERRCDAAEPRWRLPGVPSFVLRPSAKMAATATRAGARPWAPPWPARARTARRAGRCGLSPAAVRRRDARGGRCGPTPPLRPWEFHATGGRGDLPTRVSGSGPVLGRQRAFPSAERRGAERAVENRLCRKLLRARGAGQVEGIKAERGKGKDKNPGKRHPPGDPEHLHSTAGPSALPGDEGWFGV